jgi:hypothetical protein
MLVKESRPAPGQDNRADASFYSANPAFYRPVVSDGEHMTPKTLLHANQESFLAEDRKSTDSVICLVMLVTKRDRWESTSQGRVMCEHY